MVKKSALRGATVAIKQKDGRTLIAMGTVVPSFLLRLLGPLFIFLLPNPIIRDLKSFFRNELSASQNQGPVPGAFPAAANAVPRPGGYGAPAPGIAPPAMAPPGPAPCPPAGAPAAFCTKCGVKMELGSRFCPECGSPAEAP